MCIAIPQHTHTHTQPSHEAARDHRFHTQNARKVLHFWCKVLPFSAQKRNAKFSFLRAKYGKPNCPLLEDALDSSKLLFREELRGLVLGIHTCQVFLNAFQEETLVFGVLLWKPLSKKAGFGIESFMALGTYVAICGQRIVQWSIDSSWPPWLRLGERQPEYTAVEMQENKHTI